MNNISQKGVPTAFLTLCVLMSLTSSFPYGLHALKTVCNYVYKNKTAPLTETDVKETSGGTQCFTRWSSFCTNVSSAK